MATTLGPDLASHKPPKKEEKPKEKIAMVNVRVTCEMLQPNCLARGTRNTLHAYTAPSAICIKTPAAAINQRLSVFFSPIFKIHAITAKIARTSAYYG